MEYQERKSDDIFQIENFQKVNYRKILNEKSQKVVKGKFQKFSQFFFSKFPKIFFDEKNVFRKKIDH